jgi:hypothetical protein
VAFLFFEGRAWLARLGVYVMVLGLLSITDRPPYGFPVFHKIGELVALAVWVG